MGSAIRRKGKMEIKINVRGGIATPVDLPKGVKVCIIDEDVDSEECYTTE